MNLACPNCLLVIGLAAAPVAAAIKLGIAYLRSNDPDTSTSAEPESR
jgi:hypothetical protein